VSVGEPLVPTSPLPGAFIYLPLEVTTINPSEYIDYVESEGYGCNCHTNVATALEIAHCLQVTGRLNYPAGAQFDSKNLPIGTTVPNDLQFTFASTQSPGTLSTTFTTGPATVLGEYYLESLTCLFPNLDGSCLTTGYAIGDPITPQGSAICNPTAIVDVSYAGPGVSGVMCSDSIGPFIQITVTQNVFATETYLNASQIINTYSKSPLPLNVSNTIISGAIESCLSPSFFNQQPTCASSVYPDVLQPNPLCVKTIGGTVYGPPSTPLNVTLGIGSCTTLDYSDEIPFSFVFKPYSDSTVNNASCLYYGEVLYCLSLCGSTGQFSQFPGHCGPSYSSSDNHLPESHSLTLNVGTTFGYYGKTLITRRTTVYHNYAQVGTPLKYNGPVVNNYNQHSFGDDVLMDNNTVVNIGNSMMTLANQQGLELPLQLQLDKWSGNCGGLPLTTNIYLYPVPCSSGVPPPGTHMLSGLFQNYILSQGQNPITCAVPVSGASTTSSDDWTTYYDDVNPDTDLMSSENSLPIAFTDSSGNPYLLSFCNQTVTTCGVNGTFQLLCLYYMTIPGYLSGPGIVQVDSWFGQSQTHPGYQPLGTFVYSSFVAGSSTGSFAPQTASAGSSPFFNSNAVENSYIAQLGFQNSINLGVLNSITSIIETNKFLASIAAVNTISNTVMSSVNSANILDIQVSVYSLNIQNSIDQGTNPYLIPTGGTGYLSGQYESMSATSCPWIMYSPTRGFVAKMYVANCVLSYTTRTDVVPYGTNSDGTCSNSAQSLNNQIAYNQQVENEQKEQFQALNSTVNNLNYSVYQGIENSKLLAGNIEQLSAQQTENADQIDRNEQSNQNNYNQGRSNSDALDFSAEGGFVNGLLNLLSSDLGALTFSMGSLMTVAILALVGYMIYKCVSQTSPSAISPLTGVSVDYGSDIQYLRTSLFILQGTVDTFIKDHPSILPSVTMSDDDGTNHVFVTQRSIREHASVTRPVVTNVGVVNHDRVVLTAQTTDSMIEHGYDPNDAMPGGVYSKSSRLQEQAEFVRVDRLSDYTTLMLQAVSEEGQFKRIELDHIAGEGLSRLPDLEENEYSAAYPFTYMFSPLKGICYTFELNGEVYVRSLNTYSILDDTTGFQAV